MSISSKKPDAQKGEPKKRLRWPEWVAENGITPAQLQQASRELPRLVPVGSQKLHQKHRNKTTKAKRQ